MELKRAHSLIDPHGRNYITFHTPPAELTIGRGGGVDMHFDDPRMSRGGKVAIVWDGRYFVENRGATNPPSAGGREIAGRAPLDGPVTYGHLLIEPHEGGFSIFHLTGKAPRLSERMAHLIREISQAGEGWGDGRV